MANVRPTEELTCSSCYFYRGVRNRKVKLQNGQETMMNVGECRRFPPTSSTSYIVMDLTHPACGEYREAVQSKPDTVSGTKRRK